MRFTSFGEILSHYARKSPESTALRFENRGVFQSITYTELLRTVEERAETLRSTGKTCLGIFADGSFACVVELFAAAGAGMQVVLLDAGTPVPLLRGLLPYTDIDILWGTEDLCAKLAPNLTQGVKNGAGKLLFFTSGTTERSKAVTLTQKSLCSSAYNGGTLLPLTQRDTLLCLLPLNHVFGFVCGLLWGLSCGACVALGRGRHHYADDLTAFRPTALSVVPTQLDFLLRHDLLSRELRLLLVGAGDCPGEWMEAARGRGIRVSFGYGLTETSSGVALSLGDDPFAMTVCPDDEITLAPDGEILVRVRTCMMKGYYKCPEDTNAVLVGGVLHTGDLGRFDKRGRLHVTGRKKDILILPDGTKLFLPEAEQELCRILGVSDLALTLKDGKVALVLSSDTRDDQAILSAIEPYQGTHPRSQQVAAIIRRGTPLPRTLTGKIKRWELNA